MYVNRNGFHGIVRQHQWSLGYVLPLRRPQAQYLAAACNALRMSLSHETLRPLTYSTVPFEYCDDRKLWSLATRFVPTSADDGQGKTTCSLLLCAGISLRSCF